MKTAYIFVEMVIDQTCFEGKFLLDTYNKHYR